MALTTNTIRQSGGVTNRATGYVVTDSATAVDTTFTLGFVPRIVKFVNLTDRITDEWYDGMAAYSSLHAVAAGTQTLETTNGISVSTTGTFTVKAATILANKTFVWEAVG